jgi:hypothetical protein
VFGTLYREKSGIPASNLLVSSYREKHHLSDLAFIHVNIRQVQQVALIDLEHACGSYDCELHREIRCFNEKAQNLDQYRDFNTFKHKLS